MKEGYKLIIFANSIFGENKKGPIRKVDVEIQQYGISFKRCRYCGGNEVREKYFVSQEFIDPKKLLEIDLIQITYPSSPRGVHSIIVGEGDYYNSGRNSQLPNTYKGWGSYPSNLYIPIKWKYFTIEEIADIEVIAIRNEVPVNNLQYFIGSIAAGEGGNWSFYINQEFKREQTEPELFGHPSCIKDRKFSELEESDLYMGINRDYFERIGNTRTKYKSFYVCSDGSEVYFDHKIYVPYKTDKGMLVLLALADDDFTGIDENYNPVYYDKDDNGRVRVYYESPYERGVNFDYAERGKISTAEDKEEIEEAG